MTVVLNTKAFVTGGRGSLLPVIMELKFNQLWMQSDAFAWLKKYHPLETFLLEELKEEFNRLTGETILSLLDHPGSEGVSGFSSEDYAVFYWHANIVGSPKIKVSTEMVPTLLAALVGVIC